MSCGHSSEENRDSGHHKCGNKSNPRQLEYDEIIDFLIYLKDDLDLQWRTIKLYVAGLRYYYQEIVEDADLSRRIPYPNDERTIP